MKTIRHSLLAAALLTSHASAQGTFPPPSGPTVPIMKSLAQIDPGTPIGTAPFSITAPGRYYLTANLSFAGSAINISAGASGATLDLRGFQISTPSSTASTAILLSGGASDVTVGNGTIRGAYAKAVDAAGNLRCAIHDLTVTGATGVSVILGPGGRMTGCTVQASGNSSSVFAIEAQEGATVENCIVRGEAALFGAGYSLAESVTAANCKALGTNGDGFKTTGAAVLEKCLASHNTGDGFDLAAESSARECTARENGQFGFLANAANRLAHCHAAQNTFSGYSLGANSSLDASTSHDNRQSGVVVAGSARIVGCTLTQNDLSGITSNPVGLNAPVLIEANSILNSGSFGISGFATSPIIIRNQISANFSGPFAGGLTPAPIQAPATATNPFANFGP